MKKTLSVAALAVSVFTSIWVSAGFAQDAGKAADLKGTDAEGRISYALGYNLASQMKDALNLDPDLFRQGIRDSMAGTPAMTLEELQKTLQEFQVLARQKQMAAMKKKGAENKAQGQAFLAANREKDGVKVLPSGLQYKVLKAGTGESPKAEDRVKCHYRGTLIDGNEFDSSYKREKPAVFPVKGVIKGWTEALQMMKVGGKWMLYVPSDLAYGERGNRGIAPNATLIFEVELLGIEKG